MTDGYSRCRKCGEDALREDRESGDTFCAECGCEPGTPVPARPAASVRRLYADLASIFNYCELGLGSHEPAHWEAALQDVLRVVQEHRGQPAERAPT